MTNAEFKAWMSRLRLTYRQAAIDLGLSERAVYNYADDREIPLYIELACAELERRHHETPFDASQFIVNYPGRRVVHAKTGAEWVILHDWEAGLVKPGQLSDAAAVKATLDASRAFQTWHRNAVEHGVSF